MPNPPSIEVHGLSYVYGTLEALHDVNLSFESGVTGLMGVNGAGKTTLMLASAGVLRPTSGTVRISGCDPYRRDERLEAVSQVGLVPQGFDFPGRFTLREFLTMMAWMRGVSRGDRGSAVESSAHSTGLQDRLDSRLRELSGGMLRRAAIAQALLADCRILLLDEPTTGLDPQQRESVRELVGSIAMDRCVILASHVVEDIAYLAGRVVILNGGRTVFDGRVEDLERKGSDAESSRGSPLERGFLEAIGATP